MSSLENIRTGFGYDVHPLEKGRDLILGGVHVAYEKGLAGHSDADVLLHAVMDALLGAAGKGDIGTQFPDTDPSYKGAHSRELLKKVAKLLAKDSFVVNNLDVTLVAEAPKIQPYVKAMIQNIASDLGVEPQYISIKATTAEGMGFVGRKEGMVAHAVATIVKK